MIHLYVFYHNKKGGNKRTLGAAQPGLQGTLTVSQVGNNPRVACVLQVARSGRGLLSGCFSVPWAAVGPLILASFLYEWYNRGCWKLPWWKQGLRPGDKAMPSFCRVAEQRWQGRCAQLENCRASCLKYNIKSVPLISTLRKGH